MYLKRPKKLSSFGPDGRRLGGGGGLGLGGGGSCGLVLKPVCANKSNRLFSARKPIKVQRAPFLNGLTTRVGAQKKFVRPMLKRRAYGTGANLALKKSTLGMKKRTDGMARLLSRAGKGLAFRLPQKPQPDDGDDSSGDESEEEEEKEPERPFEPLMLWKSPHQGGRQIGIPPRMVTKKQTDEFGIEETVTVLEPASLGLYSKSDVFVPPILAKWLRPHQREGVKFMYECVLGLRDFRGNGCILADDMGLGKTLQSVALIYSLLKTGVEAKKGPTCSKVIVVCPCSLVKNWDNEFKKWLGTDAPKTIALAEADRKTVEKNIDAFGKMRMFNVLICSYECLRSHSGRLKKFPNCCDLLVCDEAHRLKNNDNQTSKALNSLPVKRRVLLTGTPMQNDLQEFFAMVDFTNPGILGTQEEFRRNMLGPILRGREPDATERQKQRMMEVQNEMSTTVDDFILRRVNTLNAQHLPPKLVQVVCCNLTDIQRNMYQHLVNSKDMQHVLNGKQVNCLSSIQMLMKLANHPSLVAQSETGGKSGGRRATSKQIRYNDDEPTSAAPGADGIAKFLPHDGAGGRDGPVHPEWSGKMFVLYRLMKEMRRPGNGGDKIVIISNYTQTLDLIGRMCRQNSWGFCRLDGSVTMKKRQKMVDEFNDPESPLVAFLLSSKAGGCGLNLIGGNRLVLFDPDWNPAVDKQAAARCWRDGQRKRCFTYRFLATGTVEEKIFQRQLSKEGLQSVVDDKEQVNSLSTKDLRNLFKLRTDTPSDTHDKLCCERCKIIKDSAESEEREVLPKRLAACREFIVSMMNLEDSVFFHKPLDPTEHGRTREEYERLVKQPMDLGTILTRLESQSTYKDISGVSRDVSRIFGNVLKVWSPGEEIADASRRLQGWWITQWGELAPKLMMMKPDSDGTKDETSVRSGNVDHTCESVSNERGDNYQEQIGMPEEEDMRNWSHHYTTGTVDDPIFRAAMRGIDAVSFVFGLEVTWSLLQQREQEEEERKAMQELGGDDASDSDGEENPADSNGDDDGSSSVDEKPKAPPAPRARKKRPRSNVGSDDEDSEIEDDGDDDMGDFIADGDDEEVGDQPDDDVGEEEFSDAENEVELSESPEESETPLALSDAPASVAVEDEVGTPSSNPPASGNGKPGPRQWACEKCTMNNANTRRKCEMCRAPKPAAAKKRRAAST